MKEKSWFSENEAEYFNDGQDKFELISCPLNGKFCTSIRPSINRDYADSEIFRRNKQYEQSLEKLKAAFFKTYELPSLPCGKCAALYRNELTNSIQEMHDELKRMEKGLFSTKRYVPEREKIDSTLNMLKGNSEENKIAV